MTDPLIVTAVLAEDAQRDLDDQRRRYFPAARRVVGAHVTLFHALPGDELVAVTDTLRAVVDRPAPALTVAEPFALGHGVAYRLRSEELAAVREEVARAFRGVLTAQDARRWRPHLTVQNKVGRDEARATLAALTAEHSPYDTEVTGLALWHYRGGPWESAGDVTFRPARR